MKFSRQCFLLFCLFLLSAGFSSAFADFMVKEEDIYDPCYRFPVRENYGNGQTCRFRRSMLGGYILTPAEICELTRFLPIKESKRFYGRVAVGSASYYLTSFRNKSSDPADVNAMVNVTSATKSSPVVEIAVGYVDSPTFRYELEYIANRNFTYTANPVLVGGGAPPRSFTSVIQTNPILLNFYYDFKWFERFKPYVMAGIGFSINGIRSTVSPPPPPVVGASSTRFMTSGSFVYGIGIGFRIRMFSHWYVDAKLRYINLGIMQMKASPNFQINGTMSMVPATIGVLYLY